MSSKNQQPSKKNKSGNNKITVIISAIAVVLLIAAFFIVKGNSGGDSKTTSIANDLVIQKNEITETAKFYPINAGGKKMEILAVKAGDGTIRTAFNTCQVCNGSPRAYYKQEGDTLVCQNCGNVFKTDMVEQERGGCNPVPIMKENKAETTTGITISKDFITENSGLFTSDWKTQ